MEKESIYPLPVWRRWDIEVDDGNGSEVEKLPQKQFFELCPLPMLPSDSIFENNSLRPDIQFLPTSIRIILRHIPTIVLITTVLVLIEAELRPNIIGISSMVSGLSFVPALFIIFVWGGITLIFIKSGVVPPDAFLKSSVIASLGGIHAIGTVYEVYHTFKYSVAGTSDPHVTYFSSTLLISLIVGMLSYDLLLKGENMFSKLGQTNIFDENLYEKFKYELANDLEEGIYGVQYGYIFATLFLFNFIFIWSLQGPSGVGLVTGLIYTTILDFVLLFGVFQFLIGITGIRRMMRGDLKFEGEKLEPEYLPYHPDGHAGFGDIGTCAMQINIILILMGGFYVWRGYFAGLRTLPTQPSLPFSPFYADLIGISELITTQGYEWLLWSSNYLVPIAAYILIVSFWFYYTFWEIHKRMVKGKKDKILTKQSHLRSQSPTEASSHTLIDVPSEDGDSTIANSDLLVGNYNDQEPWVNLHDAPEWPIDTKKLAWIISGNGVPVLFSIPTLIPELIII